MLRCTFYVDGCVSCMCVTWLISVSVVLVESCIEHLHSEYR